MSIITRNENGKLQQNLAEWDEFVHNLFKDAENVKELEFIGQLVESLQDELNDRIEEMEDIEDEE